MNFSHVSIVCGSTFASSTSFFGSDSKVETPVKEEVKPEKKTEKKPAKEHSHTKKNVREEKPDRPMSLPIQ